MRACVCVCVCVTQVQRVPLALWGLDRIDQRDTPLDKQYKYGSAKGAGGGEGVTIYQLDSGIRLSHQEFRAWEAGQPPRASYGSVLDACTHACDCPYVDVLISYMCALHAGAWALSMLHAAAIQCLRQNCVCMYDVCVTCVTCRYDFVDDDSESQDCDGHGTHVAATVIGRGVGVAKSAKLVAVRVLDCKGR